MNFTETLVEIGYKPYIFISKNKWNATAEKQAKNILNNNPVGIVFKSGSFNSEESSFFVPCTFNHIYTSANFNCMQNGGTTVYFIKDNNFENPLVFGLNEYNQPPTLIFPRPNIKYIFFNEKINEKDYYTERYDLAMNFCLKNETPIEILNAIKSGFIFNYDVTKNP